LASLLDDGPIELKLDTGDTWAPQNFDHENHGFVPLYKALAKSYNLSTARMGLEIGVPRVIRTLRRLGVKRSLKPYPSLLLGAVALSPLEVAQMYHSLATGGFHSQLRAIREVLTNKGDPLQRYPLSIEQVVEPGPMYLLNMALHETVRNGTGVAVYWRLPSSVKVFGKTGTSDDLRDSWFAGYTEDKLGIVWVGMDNNDPTGLTGSSGALRVWADIFKQIKPVSGERTKPQDIEMALIDNNSGLIADSGCESTVELPFIRGSVPVDIAPCAGGRSPSIFKGIKGLKGLF
jgi:penicillin-binding protein 1B